MRYIFCLLLLAVTSCSKVQPKQTPEQVIMAFFSPSGMPGKERYYTGEMLSIYKNEPTFGESIPTGTEIALRFLSESEGRSVFGVSLTKDGTTEDYYVYMIFETGNWKLDAVRALALTGIPAMVLQELEQKPQRTSKEEWDLQNLKLLFKSDAELKNYVLSNIEQLERIVLLTMSEKSEEALSEARKLFIDSIQMKSDGRVELIIGGMVDNSVGFTYVPKGKTPPPITPNHYIYVELVRDCWYVFKTT